MSDIEVGKSGLYVPSYVDRDHDKTRIAVVGFGHIGPLGLYGTQADGTKVTEAWDNLLNGVNGIKLISHELFPEFAKYPNIQTKLAGYVDKTDEDLEDMLADLGSVADPEFKSRSTKLAEIAAKMALFDAKMMVKHSFKRGIRTLTSYRIDPEIADGVAVIGGTGIGGASDSIVEAQQELERKVATGEKIDPVWVFRALPGANEESVTIDDGAHGESFGTLGECATGNHAAGAARRIILADEAFAAVAVTAESTIKQPIGVALFDALGALTKGTDPDRFPHSSDVNNDGFGFGEGGTAMVLMREDIARLKGLPIYAIFSGYGATSDGFHLSFPREDGKYQKRAMEKALEQAGGPPKEGVMFISEHATGTKPPGSPSADAIEAMVTRQAIEESLQRHEDPRTFEEVIGGASSSKPLTGHLLGDSALTEAMFAALAIKHGKMPGNWKTEELLEEAKRLNMVVNTTREGEVTMAMNNAFGFGGKNATLVLEDPNLNSPS